LPNSEHVGVDFTGVDFTGVDVVGWPSQSTCFM